MSQAVSEDEEIYTPRELPIGGGLFSYISVLSQHAPGTIAFRTGSGRILRDLLLHWPTFEGWEEEAQDICKRITDAVYPLTSALFAQAIEISVTISASSINAPTRVDALSTYVLFDMERETERLCFLSPKHPLPEDELLNVGKGIAVLCRPLNYGYHTIKDDRPQMDQPQVGLYELVERLVNALNAIPEFIPKEIPLLDSIKTDLKLLPNVVAGNETARAESLALDGRNRAPDTAAIAAIAAVSSLSSLPQPVREMERRLMTYATDETTSPGVRLKLRETAQALREQYPQALIEEAARHQMTRPTMETSLSILPRSPHTTQQVVPVATIQAPMQQPQPVPPPARFDRRVSKIIPQREFTREGDIRRTPPFTHTEKPLSESLPQPEQTHIEVRPSPTPIVQPTPTQQPTAPPAAQISAAPQTAAYVEPPRSQLQEMRAATQPVPQIEPSPRPQAEQARATPQESKPRREAPLATEPLVTAESRVNEPAPQREQARVAELRRTVEPPEARPITQPAAAERRVSEAVPQKEQARVAEPRRTVEPPEARPTTQPAAAEKRTSESTPQREQAHVEPRQAASPSETKSAAKSASAERDFGSQFDKPTRPLAQHQEISPSPQGEQIRVVESQPQSHFHVAEERASRSIPRREQETHIQQSRPFVPPSEIRHAIHPLSSRHGEHQLAPHRLDEFETRPNGFYEGLKTPLAFFPKAVPISGVGKLNKIVRPASAKAAVSPHKAFPVIRPWAFPTPSPIPTPRSSIIWGKK